MKSGRFLLVLLMVSTPLIVNWVYKELIYPRPHWVNFYDPEMAYYFSGHELMEGKPPTHIHHPGTPLQWLMAGGIQLGGDAPEEIPKAQRVTRWMLLGLVLLGVGILKLTLFRTLPVLLS
ncbi:MAG: hypothetical protein ACR2QW_16195, partial [bacterium]